KAVPPLAAVRAAACFVGSQTKRPFCQAFHGVEDNWARSGRPGSGCHLPVKTRNAQADTPRPPSGRPGIAAACLELCRLLGDSDPLRQPPYAFRGTRIRSMAAPTSG